jgi:hypothetical protein
MSSDKAAPPSIPPRKGSGRPASPEGRTPPAAPEGKTTGAGAQVFTAERTAATPSAKSMTDTGPTPAPSSTAPVAGADGWPAKDSGRGPAVPRPGDARSATEARPAAVAAGVAPRRVRLAISRVDPWSVMKLSFLLSVAIGIMMVVAAAVVWLTLDGMHVFTKVDSLVREVVGAESKLDILQYVEFGRIVSAAALIAVVDVFLMTALSTIGAFLYNIVAALVGGVHVTMTDE